MPKVKCDCCNKETKYKGYLSDLGEFVKQTGWHIVINHDTKAYRICPECYDKLSSHAKAIMDIIHDEYIFFPSLLRK